MTRLAGRAELAEHVGQVKGKCALMSTQLARSAAYNSHFPYVSVALSIKLPD